MTDAPETSAPPETAAPAPGRLSRGRRYTIRGLLVVATILTILAVFAIWANRQILNANNWGNTSTALLASAEIRTQLSTFIVDQVYANVNVTGEVQSALPPRLKPLAGPAANGLRELAENRMNRLLQRPRIQEAWRAANEVTAQQFINIAEGKSRAITQQGNAVVLDLRPIVVQLTQRLGLPNSLADKIPPNAGAIKIMSGNQVGTLQNGANALRGLAIVLPLVAFALFALAVYLAQGRRRKTLLFVGMDLILAGVVVLVARTLIGNAVIDSLAKTDAIKPAAHATWSIATDILRDVAQASIIIGIPVVLGALLAGPTRPATALRRWAAPWLRDSPVAVYTVVGVVVLLVIAWGPIPATRQVIPILIMIVLVIVGVQALRRLTAEEFPNATSEATRASLRASVARARGSVRGGRAGELERLAALHDKGVLSDEEFAAQKASILGDGVVV
jgi:putative oligomerization/nucleic acid binding protein